MKNKISDLNNHLFAALERLNDESLKGDELAEELLRAKEISNLGSQIINCGNLALKATALELEYRGFSDKGIKMPMFLGE